MATSAAIAPLPAMPMSIFLTFRYITATAETTPAAAARFVTMAISGKRPSIACGKPPSPRLRAGPGFKPDPAEPQDQDAQAEQRHVVPRDGPRLAVGPVLAA